MAAPRIRVLATAFAAVPGSSPHGAVLLSLIDALRADLDLVTLKTEDLSHIKRIGDARMFRVPVGNGTPVEQRQAFGRAVARQIEAEAYQVVHVLDPWSGLVAAERAAGRGFELVYELAAIPEIEEAETWLPAHRATLEKASRILVPTRAAAVSLKALGLGGRIEVVRPGVDVGAFDHVEVPPLGAPRVLYLGPFSELRDLATVLEAIGKVAAHRPVRALLAGERRRDRRAAVRERVAEMGLSAVIDVRGEPNPRSLPGLIAAADVCLATGADHRVDGVTALPQPLLEYAASFRPVIAANIPGVSEVIRDEVEGLLYPPGDAGALADAVLEVLRDAVLRERITDAGYRRVRDELGAGARRRRVRRLYEELAPGSQFHDPWEENFEEVTGLIELSTNALAALEESASEPPPPPGSALAEAATTPPSAPPLGAPTDPPEPGAPTFDTAEHRAPFVPKHRRGGEGSKTLTDPGPPTTDTQPGLVVPDTDPGRR